MIKCSVLLEYANELLKVNQFNDYCPNGLQVEGREEVSHIVSGVTASRALIEAAITASADAILVHHGYFWKGGDPVITGIRRRRIGLLIESNINLIAYHLPLDAHPELGNNACFGKLLDIMPGGVLDSTGIGMTGELPESLSIEELAAKITRILGRIPQVISIGDRPIKNIGWCTGAAQGYIEQAAALGLDAFVSGEISERTFHLAREYGIHYIAAGHHATERYGVQALGNHLAEHLGITHQYIEIENPV